MRFYKVVMAACLLVPSMAYSQAVDQFACQFTNSQGYTFKEGRWTPTQFRPDDPFFLTVEDNVLTPVSVARGLGAGDEDDPAVCNSRLGGDASQCDTASAMMVVFNHVTGLGATSSLAAVAMDGEVDSDVFMQLFHCQKM